MSRAPARHRRALWLLALLFGLSVSSRGVCFMAEASAGHDRSHDCCQHGLRAAAPPCCMSMLTAAPAARLAARVSPVPPLAMGSACAEPRLAWTPQERIEHVREGRLAHAPPHPPVIRV